MTINYLNGKTLFVVNLRNSEGGQLYGKIAEYLLENNFQGVAVKVCHGNHFNPLHPPTDMDELVRRLAGRVAVYGWHWNEGFDPEGEATIAVDAINRWKLRAYMMDYESPMKSRPDAQVPILSHFRIRKPSFPLGLCSYRYPVYHPEILWNEILPFFDFHAPQVYWEELHNPVEQLDRSYSELIALKDMPFIPVGAAYSDDPEKWKPTELDIRAFDAACQSKGFPGAQYFSYRGAKSLGLLPVLADLDWGVPAPVPDPDPPIDCQALIDAAVAECRAEYELMIKEINDRHMVELVETARRANNEALESLIDPYRK